VDVGRSFTYILEDEEWWKKVLIAGLLTLIPIVGQFYGAGYMLAALANVIAGREVPLPDALEDVGAKIGKGFMVSVIVLIYALPLIIVGACSGAGSAFPGFATDYDTEQILGIVTIVWSACFGCIAILYGVLMGLMLPFAIATYADTGQFGAALKVGDIFAMLRSNIGPAFIVLVMTFVAALAASIAGSILCGIGLFATAIYAQLALAYLYGSLYRQARPAVL